MNTDRDPRLMALFAQADTELNDAAFATEVMRMIDGQRRRTMLVWSLVVVIALASFAVVAGPVLAAVTMATELLPTSLVDVETDWLQQVLAPINSIAAAIALGFLAIRKFYRRLFR